MSKKCHKCGEIKTLEEYSKNKFHKNGVQTYCRVCSNSYKKSYRSQKRSLLKNRSTIEHGGIKKCSKCNENKNSNMFRTSIENIDGKRGICKICENSNARELNRQNPKKAKIKQLRNIFSMTMEEYENLNNKQGGKCDICNLPETFFHQNGRIRSLSVDHDHSYENKTGKIKIRGLLCSSCNLGIGNLKDSIEILKNAIAYLEKSK